MVKRRTKNRRRKSFPAFRVLFILLLLGIGSWVLYFMINRGLTDMMKVVGVDNFYLQNGVILGIVIVALVFLGLGIRPTLERLVRR